MQRPPCGAVVSSALRYAKRPYWQLSRAGGDPDSAGQGGQGPGHGLTGDRGADCGIADPSESGRCTSETVNAERDGSSCRGRWRASTRGRDARCNGSGSFRLGGPTQIGTPVSAAAIICTNRRCSGPWPRRCGGAGSRSGRRATRCGTRSPRTCWRVARTSGRCRSYSVIATSRPPCCTRMCSTGAGSASGVLRTVQDWGT